MKLRQVRPLAERLWERVNKTSGCWLWSGSKNSMGYGVITQRGHKFFVHRLSYEIAYGHFERSLFVCHKCDVPLCVRPDHLFLGTQFDNMRDAFAKGRVDVRTNLKVTHCPQGHPYSADNLVNLKSGYRRCKACARVRNKAYRMGRKS